MVKFLAIASVVSALGFAAVDTARACGGGSCSMSAAPVSANQAASGRTYSYGPMMGTARGSAAMRGAQSTPPRSADAKVLGN